MSPLRILIAEDHTLLRESLRALVLQEPGWCVVGEVGDGASAVEQALECAPDVVLMDVRLPILDGIEATQLLVERSSHAHVLALSVHDDANTIERLLEAGAKGFLPKGCDAASFREAIRIVARGDMYLHTSVLDVLSLDGVGLRSQVEPLTQREQEIVCLIAQGNTSKEIAEQLGLQTKTVQNYRARVMEKLGLKTIAQLVRYALRMGWVE